MSKVIDALQAWGRINIDAETIKTAKKDRGSFKRALEYEMDKFKEDFEIRWEDSPWAWQDEDPCIVCGHGMLGCMCPPADAAEEWCPICGDPWAQCQGHEFTPARSFDQMLKDIYRDKMIEILNDHTKTPILDRLRRGA